MRSAYFCRNHVINNLQKMECEYLRYTNYITQKFFNKPIRHVVCAGALGQVKTDRVMQLKLHEPTMTIGYSLRMCAPHVDSTNPGRSNLVFRSKPIPETEMSNRLI